MAGGSWSNCWPSTATVRTIKLTTRRLHAVLRAAGRQRDVADWAERLQALFREERLRRLPLVEEALGHQAQAPLLQLDAACRAVDQLAEATSEAFHQHPDAESIASFPGLADLTGARVLAELGDDRTRFADARALKAYAGSAPITHASGKSLVVHHRKVKNRCLAAAGYVWAFVSLRAPGSGAHYDRRRGEGDRHSCALRNTFDRMPGCLYQCLQEHKVYDELVAFRPRMGITA